MQSYAICFYPIWGEECRTLPPEKAMAGGRGGGPYTRGSQTVERPPGWGLLVIRGASSFYEWHLFWMKYGSKIKIYGVPSRFVGSKYDASLVYSLSLNKAYINLKKVCYSLAELYVNLFILIYSGKRGTWNSWNMLGRGKRYKRLGTSANLYTETEVETRIPVWSINMSRLLSLK
jgi:hypothetical protein